MLGITETIRCEDWSPVRHVPVSTYTLQLLQSDEAAQIAAQMDSNGTYELGNTKCNVHGVDTCALRYALPAVASPLRPHIGPLPRYGGSLQPMLQPDARSNGEDCATQD